MRSWVFRNRRRLETIYGSPGRSRPLTAPLRERTEDPQRPRSAAEPAEPRILVYEMIPSPRRPLRQAG